MYGIPAIFQIFGRRQRGIYVLNACENLKDQSWKHYTRILGKER